MKKVRWWFRRHLLPDLPSGMRAGQVCWPSSWSLEEARLLALPTLPVAKRGVDNPLLPPRRIDCAELFGRAIAIAVVVVVIAMFVGGLLEDDVWMFLRDFGLLQLKSQA